MAVPRKTYESESTKANQYLALREEMSDWVVRGMKKHKVTGMSIALVDEGDIVWAEGFGFADKANKRQADVNTLYKVGSITKVFTGTAIMQLVEQGKVDLDVPIQQYIPELKPKYHTATKKPITLRSIMSHTSGLPVDALHGMFNRHPEPFHKAIDYINDVHAPYEPGTIATYSNLGTDLLGVVIERVSGQRYADYMRDNILKPLGMESSTFDTKQVDQEKMSLTYLGHRYHEEFDLRSLPAGGLNSSARDMTRFMTAAMNQGKPILSPTAYKQMLTRQTAHTRYRSGEEFGLNWVLRLPKLDYLGPVAWHNGGTINFMSSMVVLPDQGLGVVVLSNSARSIEFVGEASSEILMKAARVKHGIAPPEEKTEAKITAVPTEVAQATAGFYATLMGPAWIEQKGKKLKVRLAGKSLNLNYYEDGWFSMQYKLFGIIPLPIKQLQGFRLRVVEEKGEKLLQVSEGQAIYLGGIAVQPAPINDAWRAALGKYQVNYVEDDYPWIKRMELKQQDGVLVAAANFGKLGAISLLLKPISNDMAIIDGLGRSFQETVYLKQKDGSPHLYYNGFNLTKVK